MLIFTTALLAGYTWAVYHKLPFFLSRTKRRRLFVSAVIALSLVAMCCLTCCGVMATIGALVDYSSKTDKRTELATFPSGEVLENQTYYVSGWDGGDRYNRLCLIGTNGGREPVKEIVIYEAKQSLLQQYPKPLEFIHGSEKVLVLGQYILMRSIFRNGAVQWDFMPSSSGSITASAYIQSFNKINCTPFFEEGRSVRFDFDDLDLEHNVLTLRKTQQEPGFQFPEYLVFSAIEYQFPWEFDLARTRDKNGPRWTRPVPGKLVLDYSIIALPNLDLKNVHIPEERATVLAKPGATEIFSKTLELSDTNWADFKWSYTLPTGTKTGQEPEAIYGFASPQPVYFNILWRIPHSTVPWGNKSLLRVDDWMNLTAGQFEGNISTLEFVRLRREP